MNTSTLSIDIQSQLKADLTNLNTFQVDQSLKLTELVCKFIKDPKSFDFQNKLNEFATSNESIQTGVLKVVVRGLIVAFQEAKQQNYDSKKFSELLAILGLPMNTKMVLTKVYDDILISKGSVSSLNALLASNQLVDLDWSFGVTASSNDCNQVGKTFLQLKLTIRQEDNALKDVFMEMTIEQFYHFLSEMEKCKSYIDLMSSSSSSFSS